MRQRLSLGISPCPNDTYIFHALIYGLLDTPFDVDIHMADVEDLNTRALEGMLAVTKVSVGVVPYITDRYALLRSGAALGWGCGPMVVARSPMDSTERRDARIAIPGRHTTASLLLDLHGGFLGPREEMVFDAVMPAVVEGRVDCGVIIHEGRFTYKQHGLTALMDLGQWWETTFAMPLPLGVIAVRRDLDRQTAQAVEGAIADSLAYAHAHPEASQDYIRTNAQELAQDVTRAHIKTFVNEYSMDLGDEGRKAVTLIVERALGVLRMTVGHSKKPLPDLFL